MPANTDNTRHVVADESHRGIIIGVQTALTVLAVVVVCLRLYVRMRIVRSPGCDDWTMALAAVCASLYDVQLFITGSISTNPYATQDH
ncbi:hypothetical protein BDV26DRAFT_276106 [Aspergillus bertholletiae]|uniref:Integral membrane protein n=1 Tax=Aspergillus bertholletiae TaxID=1226010 RepID=A0A5N7ARN9_9EURO|nr:hypothetical protein BDV26DRAFT_276106 [Aspergillus bertholletiae]